MPGARPLVSDADRERLIALLREHYAAGLFGLDELDRRVGTVLGAQFLDEAAAAVADLPAAAAGDGHRRERPAAAGQAAARARARRSARRGLGPHQRAIPRPQHQHGHAGLGRPGRPEPSLRAGTRAES